MIAREHEQAAMSGTDDEPVSDNSYANDADEEDVALFIERLTKYTDMQELTREMCLVSRLMPMSRGSPVRSTSTTNCSMNNSKTRQACFKTYLRYLSTIRKCVTIWQEDNDERLHRRHERLQKERISDP